MFARGEKKNKKKKETCRVKRKISNGFLRCRDERKGKETKKKNALRNRSKKKKRAQAKNKKKFNERGKEEKAYHSVGRHH